MKHAIHVLATLTCVASIAIRAPTQGPVTGFSAFECPADWETRSFNAYPDLCNPYVYHVCGHHGAERHTCPTDTVFSEVLHTCDWDDIFLSTTPFVKGKENSQVVMKIDPRCQHELSNDACQPCPADWETRRYNVYARDADCSSYCVCGHQGPVLYMCPIGTLFSAELHMCDWEDRVECAVSWACVKLYLSLKVCFIWSFVT